MQRVKHVNVVCNHECVDSVNGDVVCCSCGLVLDKVYSDGIWAWDKEAPNTIGQTLDKTKVLGSYIGYKRKSDAFKDNQGKLIDPKSQRLFKRVKKKVLIISNKESETMYRNLSILKIIASTLQLPQYIIDNSAYNYHKILGSGIKIINNVSCICFCIWNSIKHFKHLTNLSELLKCFKDKGHRVNNRLLIRDHSLYNKYLTKGLKKTRSKRPADYIVRQIEALRVNKSVIEKWKQKGINCFPTIQHYFVKLEALSYKVLNILNGELRGVNPFICSVSCLYFVDIIMSKRIGYKKLLTQEILFVATGVRDSSLRNTYLGVFKKHLNMKLEV